MRINPISNLKYNNSFQGGIGVFDQNAQNMILRSCNTKQIEELKDIFSRQVNDKVFCFIYTSKNKKDLKQE